MRVPAWLTLPVAATCLLAAPQPAIAEIDRTSVTTQAEIVAEGFDGAGETNPDRDRSGLAGFSEFLRTVSARDRNADSGRMGKANVTQDTTLVDEGDVFLGVDSSGDAESAYTDPDTGDFDDPFGNGTSELEVGFDVVNAPIKFTLTGRIEATVGALCKGACKNRSARGVSSGSARVTVTDPTGAEAEAEIATFESGSDVENIDVTGTITPGPHTFSVDVEVFSGGNAGSGAATAKYDLDLRFCTAVAAAPGETVAGTLGDDVICGRSGDETLLGVDGEDIILGLAGNDHIAGGEDADTIFGGDGDDIRLYGGLGNDDIDAGPGNDGPGNPSVGNVVAGGPGNDTIDGGAGDDRIYGRCGEFLLGDPSPVCPDDPPAPGESDQDKLVGRTGADVLFGDADRDSILAGRGNDPLVEGFAGPDFIFGDAGDDSLDGGKGNDEILGEAGEDALLGADGNDCLEGGAQKDDFQGGADDDKLLARDGGRDTGTGGPGPDKGRFDGSDTIVSVAIRSFQGGC